jgi:hypothetical protein
MQTISNAILAFAGLALLVITIFIFFLVIVQGAP